MNGRKLINGAGKQLLAATALCAFSVVAPQFAQAQALNQRVLIVYNSNDADSTSVANFYATQRGIPAANLCPITPSSTTLVGFAEYLSAVKAPVQNCLNALGQTNILYIVFTYNTPYDLLAPDQAVYSLDEFVADIWDVYAPVGQYGLPPSPQPYFTAAQAEGNVYTPFVSLATFRTQNPVPIYAVWRLDAPTPTLAKGLVTKAMTAETSGLAGKVCVDETTASRGYDYDITAPDWDLHSFALMAGLAGFSVTEDQNSAEFGTAPAPLRCDGAALYSGWYSFNNYNNAFSFNTGAIGYHLDSAAAADPRGGTNWSANALLNGITATHGAVAEPFVTGWSKPDGVFRNLFEGANLGDAFLRNNFYLKWMMLNIGDPLYRPFPSGFPAVTAPQNSFEVNPQYLIGGTGSTGKITLAAAPSSDLVFTLTADQPSIATVPSTVTVHAGQTTATFPIATNAVLQDSPLLITAASSTVTLTNTLIPQNVLAMLFVAPLSVGGGASAVGTVYLNENAPANGITINLSSDNPAATVPTTVTVPAGTNILTFNISTAPVSSDTSADITASYFGATQTASFTIASSGPIVSAVTVTNIGSTTATVNWTTNVPSSSQVSYGTSTGYGSQSTLDNTLVTAHSVTLTGLSASFTYHFRVTSVDSQGRPGSSGDNVFTTTGGLIGYWNFDEGTGTIAHDTSGSGYNATVNGATWVSGKINSALSFNGGTNVVTPNIGLGTAFSISAWVNPSATQGGYVRIAETQYNGGFYLGTDSSGSKYKLIVNTGAGSTGNCGAGFGCAEGGVITSGSWHLVTATFDGTTGNLYLDGAVIASDTFTAPAITNFPLYIGTYYGGGSGWKGSIDDVRLYSRALTSTEVAGLIGPPDTTPPTVPLNVLATAFSSTQINVTWSASTDNVGVAGYRILRNGTQVGSTTTALSYSDTGLTPSTQYTYTVVAFDAAGNASAPSAGSTATTLTSDTTPPNVSITAPAANATVSNTVTVSATATDNVAVNDVRFQLDGVNLGADLTASPYTIQWDTTTATNGTHTLTAIAKDTSGNSATSSAITVTVNNSVTGPPTQGLIGYWNFDEGTGTIAHDTSGSGYNGTVNGAAWVAGKINGGLSFNGNTNVVTPNIALGTTFSITAWVNPSTTQSGYARIAETQFNLGFYLGVDVTGTKYKFIVNSGSGSTGNCGVSYGCAEGGTIAAGWHLVTATYDGATAKLYVDGVVIATDTFTAQSNTNLPLYIASYYQGGGGWKGSEDEVRLYNRALTSTEVSAIFNYTGSSDTTPPTVPGNVLATAVSSTQINVTWSASTDNVGVAGYRVFRNGTQVGSTTTALSYSDTGLTPSTQYTYTVVAFDAAGNISAPSTGSTATTFTSDTTPPNVSITAPAQNATVSNTVTVSATATDNVAVNDVRFQLDGVNLGADLTALPYTIQWDTTTASNGIHTLTAIAKDTSGNSTTSSAITVTVNNTATGPPTQGLIGYWNLDEGAGTVAHDTSGSGYDATVNGAAWVIGKINGALSFNGSSNAVTPNISLSNTFSISTWVNPSVTQQGGYVRILETQYNGGLYLGTDGTGTKYKFIVNTAMGATGNCGAAYGCAEGGTIASGWHLVTATYDGATAKLYVDGAVAASETFAAPGVTNLPLYFGTYYAGGFGWKGSEDEVRLYNRALTSTEVSAIFNYTGSSDTTPPTVPANVLATAFSSTQINITWSASTDNVGVAGYRVFRNGTQVGTTTALSYSDTGLTPSTQYTYTVVAFDAAGNSSAPSTGSTATTLTPDTTPPNVSIAAPAQNATVSNTVTVSATATDNVAVNDVRFQLDGVNLGADLTASPYTIQWDTTTATNGTHTLTAIAKDTSGNSATSSTITVTVNNTVTGPPTQGLIGYWNFDEGAGTIAHDTSGSGYNATVNGAAWVIGKINGALSFNGSSNAVTPNISLGNTFSISAWVNPSVTPQNAFVRLIETQYNGGFYLGTDVTGTKYKFIVNTAMGATGNCGAAYGCAEGGTIATGWHLVTATYDGAAAKLYVDGALMASETFMAPGTTNFPLYFGTYYGGGFGWKGGEDDVRLYNRALSAAEVGSIYNANK